MNITKDLTGFDNAIESGSLETLVRFFKDLSQDERSIYSPAARRQYKRCRWGMDVPHLDDRVKANIVVALIVACDKKEWGEIDWRFAFFNNNMIRALQELLPPSVPDLANAILKSPEFFVPVREMVQLGICEKPDSEDFSIAIIAAPRMVFADFKNRPSSFSDWIDENLDILEEDVWRIFQHEGNQEFSLSSQGKYFQSGDNWMTVLHRLAAEEKISRKRLLEESLNALGRGFIQFRSAWFSAFHDSLKPSVEERVEFTQKYLQLLGSPIGPTVAFAINNLKVLDKADKLDPDALIGNINPCMVAKQKAVVMSALALLESAVKKNENLSETASIIAIEGLLHESPEVQTKVIAFIFRYGDKQNSELSSKIESYFDAVSPSVKDKLKPWIETESENSFETELESYQYKNYFCEGWPFAQCGRIAPVENEDELLRLAGYCMENPLAAMELERLMDGVSRLEASSEKFKNDGQALVKRAEKLFRLLADEQTSLRLVIAKFIIVWLSQSAQVKDFVRRFHAPSLQILDKRIEEILERREQKKFLPLLSFPTHENGWIDKQVLESRKSLWRQHKVPFAKVDEEVAQLRIPVVPKLDSKVYTEDVKIDGIGVMDRLERPEIGPNLVLTIASYRERIMHRTIGAIVIYINFNLAESREYRHYMEMLTHSGAPLTYKAHELMNIGLIAPDVQCNGIARDAMIRAIDEYRLEPDYLGNRVGVFLKSDKAKPKRLVLSLQEVARVSPLHMDAVRQVLERALQGSTENIHRDLPALLEFYKEVLVACQKRIESDETKTFLRSIKTGGKTAKLVKELIV